MHRETVPKSFGPKPVIKLLNCILVGLLQQHNRKGDLSDCCVGIVNPHT